MNLPTSATRWSPGDTLAAIASADGPGWRGIIRISGPETESVLPRVFVAERGQEGPLGSQSRIVPGQLILGNADDRMPANLYWWPGVRTYTREPMAEFHTLGPRPLLEMALRWICSHGARMARPGEFTLRAFLHGRIDLTQAEATLQVVEASHQQELEVGLRQLAGGLSQPLNALRSQLLDLLADLEAGLDFVDEDLDFVDRSELERRLQSATDHVQSLESQLQDHGEVGSLPRIVFWGRPNVGKSSLVNALCQRPVALVNSEPGTTRDYVQVTAEIDGIPCILEDTAGLSAGPSRDEIDELAQRQGQSRITEASIRVLCIDLSQPASSEERGWIGQSVPPRGLVVGTKGDLPRHVNCPELLRCVSAHTRGGIASFRDELATMLREVRPAESVASPHARCRHTLQRLHQSLGAAAELLREHRGDELLAGELRIALDQLGHLVGTIYTDDLLDRIFSRFCIGK